MADPNRTGPPTDVEPSELFLKLLEAPRPSEVIDFPRTGPDGKPIDQIRIMALPQEEHDKARIRAFNSFKARGYTAEDQKNISMREVVSDHIAKELLVLACHTAKPQLTDQNTGQPIYGKIFHSAEDVAKVLRPGELLTLWNAYQLVQDKYGPLEREVDMEAWIRRLMEGGQHFPLLSLDLPELVTLTSSLAARIYSMSHALESQLEELPSTSRSALEKFCLGTTSFIAPLIESGEGSTTGESNVETADAVELSLKTKAQDKLSDALDIGE